VAAIPAYVRTWVQVLTAGVPGKRITYVSLADLMGNWGLITKTHLLANACSMVWSCDGVTGPANAADHTDRITTAATFEVQTAAGATATSYFVILDGNGGQLLIANVGGTADVCRISYSHTAAFALAGTTTHIPTATDEVVLSTGVTIVGATTNTDRIVHGVCSNDGKAYRFTVLRSSAIVGQTWCCESFTATPTAPATTPNPVFCGSWSPTGLSTVPNFLAAYAANSCGGYCRAVVSSTQFLATLNVSTLSGLGSATSAPASFAAAPKMQGAGFVPWPIWIMSGFAGADGVFGTGIDMWCSLPTGAVVGDGFDAAYDWWQLGPWLMPNPSVTAPTLF